MYTHILIGLDLSEECTKILQKAKALAEVCGAKISVSHTVEPLMFAYGGDMPIDLSEAQTTMESQARTRLKKIVEENGVQAQNVFVTVGHAASELHRLADNNHVDLIVVGSHSRHGLAILLGSTAKGVLTGANCDVLAIKV